MGPFNAQKESSCLKFKHSMTQNNDRGLLVSAFENLEIRELTEFYFARDLDAAPSYKNPNG